ncbi:MAG: hypothetical protein A2096_17295 [Spirochaetes bacterium GWF1_41_5]|nr:MAG: hypothetical protein A2096_17295 [Spirochaetes bacterium GWF1_41_5]
MIKIKTHYFLLILCALLTATEQKFDTDFIEVIKKKNNLSEELWKTFEPYILPLNKEPVPEGMDLAIPPELGNQKLAALGYADVTAAPFNADSTGKKDCTKAVQAAVDFSRDHDLICFFPPGTYLLSDSIICRNLLNVRANGRISTEGGACALTGSAKDPQKRAVLMLAPRSSGFTDPEQKKIFIHFLNCSPPKTGLKIMSDPEKVMAANQYNQFFYDLDIIIGEGNSGAVGLRMQAAEGSSVQSVTIDARHGHTGMRGASGSGGSHHDITVIGGRIGIDTRGFSPEFKEDDTGSQPTPVMAYVKLFGQTEAAFINKSRGPFIAVGWQIKCAGITTAILSEAQPANSPFNGSISLIDSIIEFEKSSSENCVISSERDFYFNNVYIKNAAFVNKEQKASPAGWFIVKHFAFAVKPLDYKEYSFETFPYVNNKKREYVFSGLPGEAPPADLCSRHIWNKPFPSRESEGAVNVKDAIIGAKGDSLTDDTKALQKAIDNYEIVFLPKGYYLITSTLRLKSNTKLIGTHHHLSQIISREQFFGGTYGTPLVQTADDASAQTVIAFLGIHPGGYGKAGVNENILQNYSLDWRCGSKSIARSLAFHLFRPYGFALKYPEEIERYVSAFPQVLIENNGGGKWYNFFIESAYNYLPSYRHLSIRNSKEPLSFYHLHAQDSDVFAQCEISNSANVNIYGIKTEHQTRFLYAQDCRNISVFGIGGYATAIKGSSHFVFKNCADFLLANPGDQAWLEPAKFWTNVRPYYQNNIKDYSILTIRERDSSFVCPSLERPIAFFSGKKYADLEQSPLYAETQSALSSDAPALAQNDLIKDLQPADASVKIFKTGTMRCAERYEITDFPKEFLNAVCITVPRGDSKAPGKGYSFTVSRPANIFLLVNRSGDYMPPSGWKTADLEVSYRIKDQLILTDDVFIMKSKGGKIIIPPHDGQGKSYGIPHMAVVVPE